MFLTALLPAQMEIGYDMIVYPAMIVGTFTYMGLFLAYALRAKGAKKKSLGWSCFTTMTLANISEPGLYGIVLSDRKASAARRGQLRGYVWSINLLFIEC